MTNRPLSGKTQRPHPFLLSRTWSCTSLHFVIHLNFQRQALAGISRGYNAVVVGDEYELATDDDRRVQSSARVSVPVLVLNTPTTWRAVDLLLNDAVSNVTLQVKHAARIDDR
jgi:hypothetical protein